MPILSQGETLGRKKWLQPGRQETLLYQLDKRFGITDPWEPLGVGEGSKFRKL